MAKRTLITAGLVYSNGDLHVGHLACYVPADIINRYLKLTGQDTLYICGSDDHGVTIMLQALKEKKSPEDIVRHYHDRQVRAFEGLNIKFDSYGSTAFNPYHAPMSKNFFKTIYDKGLFSKEVTEQYYDEEEGIFLPDRYVKGECGYCHTKDQNSDQCENCGKLLDVDHLIDAYSSLSGKPVKTKPTAHWFIDLSQFEADVSRWAESSTLRSQTKKYVESLVKGGLVKRSMTRDISWGIPVPLDDPDAKDKVLYVWFDAPIGYISNTQEYFKNQGKDDDHYLSWWNDEETDIVHFVGEDNTIFHCIIWIAMLQAFNKTKLPKGVIVNNFMNIKSGGEVQKISKSRKTAIWALDYLEGNNDPEYLRYYLTEIAPEKARGAFDLEEFVTLVNSNLADTLGNFINRSLSFSLKFLGDEIPESDQEHGELERELDRKRQECFDSMTTALNNYSTKDALKSYFEFARFLNKYFNDKAPWSSRKNDLEDCKLTLKHSIQNIYFLGLMLRPFLPNKAASILKIFSIENAETIPWKNALELPQSGSKVIKGDILFSKIEEVHLKGMD